MEKTELNINLQYKDRLFRLLFGREEYKANVLELYNALNDSDYKDVSELGLFTIEDVIYIKIKNDVAKAVDAAVLSCIKDGILLITSHSQSS